MGGILEPVSCPTIVLSKNALQAKRLIVCLQLSGDPSVHTILPHSLGSAANFFVGGRCSGQVETQVLRQQARGTRDVSAGQYCERGANSWLSYPRATNVGFRLIYCVDTKESSKGVYDKLTKVDPKHAPWVL